MFRLAISCVAFLFALTASANVFPEGPYSLGYLPITSASDTVTLEGHMTPDEIRRWAATDEAINDATKELEAAGLCDIAAVAFANLNFRTQTAAQQKCDELVQQTGGVATDCKVVKKGNVFQAQFRKLFQQNQQFLNVLLQDAAAFILNNNIFANNQLKVQLAVSNGCG